MTPDVLAQLRSRLDAPFMEAGLVSPAYLGMDTFSRKQESARFHYAATLYKPEKAPPAYQVNDHPGRCWHARRKRHCQCWERRPCPWCGPPKRAYLARCHCRRMSERAWPPNAPPSSRPITGLHSNPAGSPRIRRCPTVKASTSAILLLPPCAKAKATAPRRLAAGRDDRRASRWH
jgi:hypothetical protein